MIRVQDGSDVLGYSECIKIMNHILGRYFKIKTDNTYCLFFLKVKAVTLKAKN